MTPMIDVVFLLLIYFLVTFTASDSSTQLAISRPAPVARSASHPPPQMIRVRIASAGFEVNGRSVSRRELAHVLGRLADLSAEQTVFILCEANSKHAQLVDVLDLCAEVGLSQLSVGSAP